MSCAYLRLLIFLPAILIPACVSSSPAFLMMYSAYKLNNRAAAAAAAKSLQSCPTLCDPIDGSLPGSAVPRILQVRMLEWLAISFSRVSSQPRNGTRVFQMFKLDLEKAEEPNIKLPTSVGS